MIKTDYKQKANKTILITDRENKEPSKSFSFLSDLGNAEIRELLLKYLKGV